MDQKSLNEAAAKQLDRVLSFFARVEAKASFIFAVNSALLGAMALNVQKIDFSLAFNATAIAFTTAGLAVSNYYIYRCSFPNLGGGHASLVYFKEIAKLTEANFVAKYRAQTDQELTNDTLGQVWRNAEILTEKFRAVRIAFIATALSLVPWAMFLTLASQTHSTLPALK